MRKVFAVSLCREGVLGGGLYVGEDRLTYRTGKVTVSPALRRLELPLAQICAVQMGRSFVFPTVTFRMKNGEAYRFLAFAPKALFAALEELGLSEMADKG